MRTWYMAHLCAIAAAILGLSVVASDSTVDRNEFLQDERQLARVEGTMDCRRDRRKFNEQMHKRKYRVAVHAIRGFESAVQEYNLTFSKYLTETVGNRYDVPIEFEVVPVTFGGLFDAVEKEEVDFFYANPGIYSCVGVENGVQPLATIVSRLKVRGRTYDLDVFGGVMFTQADNDEVNSVTDLKDKVIAAGGISMIMAAQTQFYEMEKAGLSYVMDPKQVVFTGNQFDVVQGVLDGDFDVGFVRTDQIERHTVNGKAIDTDLFKVIEPKIYVLDDGTLFPFLHSTDIYPEWPVAALPTVPKDLADEVQDALLALQDHADALERSGVWEPLRCDTTREISELATQASVAGNLAGFRTARSYFEVRTMHEAAGFILQDDKGNWRCTRAATLYDSIKCPAEHYKLPLDEYEKSCADAGLTCNENFDCYCKPCVKAFQVDVFQWTDELRNSNETAKQTGCEKMSLCGVVQQTKKINFRVVDNQERPNADLAVLMHLSNQEFDLPVTQTADFTYEFDWMENSVGVAIMEIFINGEQIPESPIRVQVVERDCEADFPGQKRSVTNTGDCSCGGDTWDIQGKCVSKQIMAICISIFALLWAIVAVYFIVQFKNRKNDQAWHVNIEELHLDDPPEVIGQGSFGVVLLAEYRGTKVAIKRAVKAAGTRHSRHSRRSSRGKSGSKSRSKNSSKSTNNSGHAHADPAGSGSVDISLGSTDPGPEDDPELGVVGSVDTPSSEPIDPAVSGSGKVGSRNNKSGGSNGYSLGFLAEDYGGNNRFGWLFPWAKQDKYYANRFRDTILGGGSSRSIESKSWTARLCPMLSATAHQEAEFIAEMRILSRLRHPCITTVMGAVVSNAHDPMLVMEYMDNGSLYDLLRNDSLHLSGDVILQVTRDVAQGLRYLHSSKPPILHGDLKARNILIDSRFRAKLCDFGMSTKDRNFITGTPFWLAPEYLRGQVQYNAACDMFSISIIFYEIYARKNPYEGEPFRETLRKICDRRINKRPPMPKTCPPKMADLMKKLWSPDTAARPEARELDAALMDMQPRDAEPQNTESMKTNQTKKRRTGDMLYELFPRHVAEQLKAGQKVEAEQHDVVTIVYSDIVHFTDISRELQPLKVSQMLDRLYLAFDRIANKHGVFKVETIGDAYMGVTNLEMNQEETHVKQAAEFAIDMVEEASQILIDEETPEKGYIKIRVGFHSGPVVSNVIGSLNPRYGLFGETVNTASKMEQNSRPGRILCSEKSFRLLEEQAPELPVTRRGKIPIKGKGDMNVFWVGDRIIMDNASKRNQEKLHLIHKELAPPAPKPGPAPPAPKKVVEFADDKLPESETEQPGGTEKFSDE